MRVTRESAPGGTRRTSAGESKAFPPWRARYTVRGFDPAPPWSDVEVEVEGNREHELEAEVKLEASVASDRSTALWSRLRLLRTVVVRVPARRAGLVAIERTAAVRPADRRRGRSA
jgi:hypothetical protein